MALQSSRLSNLGLSSSTEIWTRLAQWENALDPIAAMVLGIAMLVMLEQPKNAYDSMMVTDSGKLIPVRLVQSLNALELI